MRLWESTEVDGSVKTVRGGGPLAGDIIRSARVSPPSHRART